MDFQAHHTLLVHESNSIQHTIGLTWKTVLTTTQVPEWPEGGKQAEQSA